MTYPFSGSNYGESGSRTGCLDFDVERDGDLLLRFPPKAGCGGKADGTVGNSTVAVMERELEMGMILVTDSVRGLARRGFAETDTR